MYKYDSRTGRLAVTGVNTCVIFLVLFMNNDEIFIEHRITMPKKINENNMEKCLSYVALHIDDLVGAKTRIP